MTERHLHIPDYSYTPPVGVKLKHENMHGLYELLESATAEWDPEYQEQLIFAFDIALRAHEDDRHKDRPYIEHVARVAARILCHIRINDPELIIAAILHDIVEDHATELVDGTLFPLEGAISSFSINSEELSESDKQLLALECIEQLFTSRVALIVAAVTNPPHENKPKEYHAKLQAYVNKVQTAIELPEAWLLKFADWCDNGLSINYDVQGQGDKRKHFKRKYGLVLPVLKQRYERDDIQNMLSSEAKVYVVEQFRRGTERLLDN